MAGWSLESSDGQLTVTTGVAGPAAKMGHRLTIGFTWQASVDWASGEPVSVDLTVEVGSLQVLRGDGGVTGLTGPEKALARSNTLKVFDAKKFPSIRFRSENVQEIADGYRLGGTLEIHGRSRDVSVDVRVEDDGAAWRMSCEASVLHSDFGLKPYSMMMGAMKVADEVAVSWTAGYAKESS
ncbi:YceI family protein [Mycobacterium sp. 236(2023)]|uniref:YceI family protein n=1 Tax=Mycobacterium sp. 236(2023) TaxID=3038163 RepID=UPI00241505F1|nr:YceI family protein [Mycobacterium sp. 236(2023)]MDG4663747.1 YceI family protein [Mycobacterium sp. 236(2023)]